jgi:hypothetical protein
MVNVINAEQLAAIQRRQKAIRRTAEAIISVGEESGCNASDVMVEIALQLAFSQDLARDAAIEMVNRAHNRVVHFMMLMDWDGFVGQMRADAVAAGANRQPKSFEDLERAYESAFAPPWGKVDGRDR